MSLIPINSHALTNMPGAVGEAASDQEPTLREKLLLREAQLSQAQRMAGMASWEWYFGGTEIQWSPEMYQFWGYQTGEVSVDLDSVARSTHVDDLPILQTAVERLLDGNDVEMEYRRYDKLGREIYIYTSGQIVRNEAGEAIGVFGIDMDITKRKQQEQHLIDLNRLLEAKNKKLEQLVAEANTFTYIASHDLQEPLRKIKSFNQLILDQESDRLSQQGQEFFRRSSAAAARMQQLITDLTAYSQVNAAQRINEDEVVDLTELVNQVRVTLYEPISSKQAHIQVDPLPTVAVNRLAFQQLFTNLISNALKYHRPGHAPNVNITYQRLASTDVPEQHQLTIADEGIGFDPVYSDRIFNLFQRLHSQQQYAGTGIGLAICRRVMQHHGGTIQAIGKPGEGATFILRWPVNL